ncbi:hypothetical protein ACFWVM_29170 [Nocardia fluminea]|uniref:hypothetical protein n=1 Tax=Nocardia fluminea TaxID=134984 RepID=UPI003651243D
MSDWMDHVIIAAARQGFVVLQRKDGRWVLHRQGMYLVLGETPEGMKALAEFLAALRMAGIDLRGERP